MKLCWAICFQCRHRFEAPTQHELDRLLENHKVMANDKYICVGKTQLEKMFNWNGKGWVKR